MQVPVMAGVIARRLLVNYRVAPDVLARLLPAPFRPQLVGGWCVAGICLIGLRAVRPRGLPAAFGLASENAAHRVAVEWDEDGVTRQGVYIPRRDTSSRINVAVGGRLFPGVHHRARFTVRDTAEDVAVAFASADGRTHVAVEGRVSAELPSDSIFGSLAAASAFFERSALGYSAGQRPGLHDGLELRTAAWAVAPLAVLRRPGGVSGGQHGVRLRAHHAGHRARVARARDARGAGRPACGLTNRCS
jgi:Uncharacterized conserved protein (COG2071)